MLGVLARNLVLALITFQAEVGPEQISQHYSSQRRIYHMGPLTELYPPDPVPGGGGGGGAVSSDGGGGGGAA